MKAVVEWGKPKSACPSRPCGVSGQFVVANPTQAMQLASQLFHTLVEGREHLPSPQKAWAVSSAVPRKVVWAADRSAWVAVSMLDGVPRGAYAALADKEALLKG